MGLLHSTLPQTGHIQAGCSAFIRISTIWRCFYNLALALSSRRAGAAAADQQHRGLAANPVHLCNAPGVSLYCCWCRTPERRGQKLPTSAAAGTCASRTMERPWLVVLQWVLWGDSSGLTVLSAVWWLALPLAYFVYAMLRARTGKPISPPGCCIHTRLWTWKAGPQKVLPQRGGGAGGVFSPWAVYLWAWTAIGIGGMTVETEEKLTKLFFPVPAAEPR